MASIALLARLGAPIGNPARACMLMALMDGRALTASELARVAGISPPTASGHLVQLSAACLLAIEKQRCSRYHRLASREVALMLERLMHVLAALWTSGANRARARGRETLPPRGSLSDAAMTDTSGFSVAAGQYAMPDLAPRRSVRATWKHAACPRGRGGTGRAPEALPLERPRSGFTRAPTL